MSFDRIISKVDFDGKSFNDYALDLINAMPMLTELCKKQCSNKKDDYVSIEWSEIEKQIENRNINIFYPLLSNPFILDYVYHYVDDEHSYSKKLNTIRWYFQDKFKQFCPNMKFGDVIIYQFIDMECDYIFHVFSDYPENNILFCNEEIEIIMAPTYYCCDVDKGFRILPLKYYQHFPVDYYDDIPIAIVNNCESECSQY